MRVAVLTIALAFGVGLGVLTARDIARYGVTPVSVLAGLIVVVLVVGIVGALRNPPDQ